MAQLPMSKAPNYLTKTLWLGQSSSNATPNYLQDLEKRKLELQSKITRDGSQDEKPVFTIKSEPTQKLNFWPWVSQAGVTNVQTKQTPPQTQETPQKSGFSLIPTANASEDLNQQAVSDIIKGMPIEEFDTYYPELASNKQIFQQLSSDIIAGMPINEISKYYPELSWQATIPETPKETWWAWVSIPTYKPFTDEDISEWNLLSTATLKNTAKYGANVVWGAYNILSWLGNMILHPVKTAEWIKDVWAWLVDIVKWENTEESKIAKQMYNDVIVKKYGSWENFKTASIEDPTAIIWDVLSAVSWWAAIAGKVSNLQKASTLSNLRKASVTSKLSESQRLAQIQKATKLWERAENLKQLSSTANKYNPYLQTPIIAWKWVKKWVEKIWETAWKIWEWITATTEYWTKLATWLNRETQDLIKNNPELFKQAKKWTLTAETVVWDVKTNIEKRLTDLNETWKWYETVKQSPVTFNKADIQDIYNNRFTKEWLTNTLIELPLEDRTAIKQAQYYLNELPENTLSSKQAIELKAKLRSLVSYDKWVSPEWERVVKWLIKDLDTNLKDNIPWFKELDAIYWPEREFLNKVKKDILNQDWTLKENSISTIRNLTWKWKEFKIDRLEQIMPWITEKVKAIKAFEDLQWSIEWKTWSYARWVLLWGWWYAMWWPVWWITTFIITHPSVASKALELYWITKQWIKNLVNKVTNKKPLTANETQTLQNAIKNTKSNNLFNNIVNDDKLSTIPYSNITTTKSDKIIPWNFTWKKLVENANLNSNNPKNAIPNPTTKISSKDWKLSRILPSNFKEKAQETVEKIADKIWARTKLMWNEWIWADKTALLKGSDDLIKEARKYKTFEDFKKSQWQELYHWTKQNFDKFDLSKISENEQWLFWRWIYTTPNKKMAENYWWNVINSYIDKSSNLVKWDDKIPTKNISNLKENIKNDFKIDNDIINHIFSIPPKSINLYKRIQDILEITPKKASELFSKSWIDWITVYKDWKLKEISLFNDTKIKTEAQLKQIYEQSKPKLLKKAN